MTDASDGLVKICVVDEGADVEILWATPLGQDRYRLENTPFFAYGLSFEDIVEARATPDDAMLNFVQVVAKSGRKTVRVKTNNDNYVPDDLVTKLVALGTTYEGANPSYLCFDIPPEIELDEIVNELKRWDESVLQWEIADPTYE